MLRKCLFIALLFCVNLSFSSSFKKTDTIPFKTDSIIPKTSRLANYYLFDKDLVWSLRLVSNFKQQTFAVKNDNETLKYTPNNPYGIGFGVANQRLIIDILFNLKTDKENPTTKFAAEGATIYKKNLLDFTWENVHGYNIEGSNNDIDIFRSDISIFSITLGYLRFLSKNDFTIRGLKSGLTTIDKTTFSYGLGGFFIFNKIDAEGNPIIPNHYAPLFNEHAEINKFLGYGGGFAIGGSTHFVLPANFFASLYVSPGVGLEYKKITTPLESYEPSNPFIYKADVFAALGYNQKKFYVNFTFFTTFYNTQLDYGNRAFLNITKSKLIFGYNLGKVSDIKKLF